MQCCKVKGLSMYFPVNGTQLCKNITVLGLFSRSSSALFLQVHAHSTDQAAHACPAHFPCTQPCTAVTSLLQSWAAWSPGRAAPTSPARFYSKAPSDVSPGRAAGTQLLKEQQTLDRKLLKSIALRNESSPPLPAFAASPAAYSLSARSAGEQGLGLSRDLTRPLPPPLSLCHHSSDDLPAQLLPVGNNQHDLSKRQSSCFRATTPSL